MDRLLRSHFRRVSLGLLIDLRELIRFHKSRLIVGLIIVLGLLLRLAAFAGNRSLWLDEARLALNIVNRTYPQLLQPLDYEQGAPVGFLFVEKFFIQLFGNTEYALRLLPLLSGIFALVVFYWVGWRLLTPAAALIALALFAITPELIYYSTEVKQYSSDVAITIILYGMTLPLLSKPLTFIRLFLFGIVGAVAVWLSHPAIFVLAGAGIALVLNYLQRREWMKITRLIIPLTLWIGSFGFLYIVSLNNLSQNADLLDYWQGSFMPFPPTSSADLRWFLDSFFKLFKNTAGLTLSGLGALAFLLGSNAMLTTKRTQYLMLIFPILLTLLVSGLHKYPFQGRLLLFIVPELFWVIGTGIDFVRTNLTARANFFYFIFISLLFVYPALEAFDHLKQPDTKEELRPILVYLNDHYESDDLLYVYYGAKDAFNYYQQRNHYRFVPRLGIYSRDDLGGYVADLNQLRGHQRVWIVFSHENGDEKAFILTFLNQFGIQIDKFERSGAAVYLYDLRGSS